MPHTLFVSYSHKDEMHKDFVVDHLRVAERQGVFDVWEDRHIKGGGNWRAVIDQALNKADIAVLLISKNFLTSDFIMDHEVQTMLKRHASDDVILYPILISDCAWQTVDWLQAINIRPTDGRPLNSFNEAGRDQVMADIASEIGQLPHPAKGQATTRPITAHQHRRSPGQGGILAWWQAASVTARATVLGTVFAGIALVWTVMSDSNGGDHIITDCGAVNTGSVEGSEINVDC